MKKLTVSLTTLLTIIMYAEVGGLSADDPKGPTEVLKAHVNSVLTILKDTKYKQEGKIDLQRENIWKVIRHAFDFNEISKRTLGRNWSRFTTRQREEFIKLFTEFLQRTYLSKIEEPLQGERIEFVREQIYDNSKAKVESVLYRKDLELPVNYSLMKKQGDWKIYDVQVEGVSLIRNYREQFSSILVRETPAELLEKLEEKLKDLQQKPKHSRNEKRQVVLGRLKVNESLAQATCKAPRNFLWA